jgi:hypothetical protein
LPEQINGDDFFIGKPGLEITSTLRFQSTRIIVDLTDKQINLNELIDHKQENLIILLLDCYFSTLDSSKVYKGNLFGVNETLYIILNLIESVFIFVNRHGFKMFSYS